MRKLLLFLFLLLTFVCADAQTDSLYIRPFPQEFTLRPYFYYKFTSLSTERDGKDEFNYHSNTPVGIGIGFTYKDYALNLAYAPPFFRDKERGKTKYLDLQYHYYGRKYLLDLYFQDYKGFYNEKKGNILLFPDIRVIQYGGTVQYLFNNKKFSYRAAFYCNEQQLRSAGSFQLGGGVYYNKLVTETTQILEGRDRFRNYQFTIMGGYSYSWIIKQYYFFTIGVSGGVNFGIENIKRSGDKMEITPNVLPRVAMGYNGKDWAIYLNSVFNRVHVTSSGGMDILFDTGRANISYVHRLGKSPAIFKKVKLLN